jgi:hypothetical protein
VREALDELRSVLGRRKLDFGELTVLGAQAKLRELRGESQQAQEARARLVREIREGAIELEVSAADEVKRLGLYVDGES